MNVIGKVLIVLGAIAMALLVMLFWLVKSARQIRVVNTDLYFPKQQ